MDRGREEKGIWTKKKLPAFHCSQGSNPVICTHKTIPLTTRPEEEQGRSTSECQTHISGLLTLNVLTHYFNTGHIKELVNLIQVAFKLKLSSLVKGRELCSTTVKGF